MPTLSESLGLLQSAVLFDGRLDAHPQAEALERTFADSTRLTNLDRLAIYQRMYASRIESVLAGECPALREAVGDEEFRHLAHGYARTHRSGSYTLAEFGTGFAAYIAQRDDLESRRRAFLRDLARLERAIAEAREAPGGAVVTSDMIASIGSDQWPQARFSPAASLRFLTLEYPVHLTYEAYCHDRPVLPWPAQRLWIVVHRQADRVVRTPIGQRAHRILQPLLAGVPLGLAIEGHRGAPEKLYHWLRDWVAAGYFQAVHF
jgi:hypothetical protein